MYCCIISARVQLYFNELYGEFFVYSRFAVCSGVVISLARDKFLFSF